MTATLLLSLGIVTPLPTAGQTAPIDEPSEEEIPLEPAGAVPDDAVDYELRTLLEIPLHRKLRELRDLTDDAGIHNVRGSFFPRFVRLDDDAYEVVFHKRTAGEEELVTERYVLTLRRDPSSRDAWFIADEKLERRVDGLLFRSVPGDETFHGFDGVSIEREGLELSAGAGTMYIDYRRGRPRSLVLVADDLRFDYAPPAELNDYQIHRLLRQVDKYRADLEFAPERVRIRCTAEECETFLAEAFRGLRAVDRAAIDPVQGEIRQRIVVGKSKAVLPGRTYRGLITLRVIGADKREYPVRILIEDAITPFAFKVPAKPREVVLNGNGEMLAHDVVVEGS